MTVQELRQMQMGDKIYFVRTPQDAAMYKKRLEFNSPQELDFKKTFTEYLLKTLIRSGIYEEYVSSDITRIDVENTFSTTSIPRGRVKLNKHYKFDFPNLFATYLEAAAYYDKQCELWKKEKEDNGNIS